MVLALRRARTRPWICAVAGVVVLALFVAVARPSPSVLRSALMALVALGALATGRPRAAVPALAGTTLALLVWNPLLAATASFAMSVLATAALLVIAPGWAQALRRRHVPPGIAESLAIAAAAQTMRASTRATPSATSRRARQREAKAPASARAALQANAATPTEDSPADAGRDGENTVTPPRA